MKQLGKLEKIEYLRSIWKHEAKDCRIYEDRPLSYIKEDDRQTIFQFFCDATNRMLKAFGGQAYLFKK